MEILKHKFDENKLHVQKINYSPHEDKIYMTVCGEKCLKYAILRNIENDFFSRTKIKLNLFPRYKDIKNISEVIEIYKENIFFMLENSNSFLKKSDREFNMVCEEDRIDIIFDNDIICKSLKSKNVDKSISQRIMEETGVFLKINIISDECKERIENFQKNNLSTIESEAESIVTKVKAENQEKKSPDAKETINKNVVSEKNDDMLYGKALNEEPIYISQITDVESGIVISGEVFSIEKREIRVKNKSGNQDEYKIKYIHIFSITDYTGSITCKIFSNSDDDIVKKGDYILVKGDTLMDNYAKEITMTAKAVKKAKKIDREDNCEEKRVELHLHTNMSEMDAVDDVKRIIKRVSEFGHRAVAITDHGVVQAFPDAMDAAKKHGVKVIYGVEGYLIDDEKQVIDFDSNEDFNHEFVVFDIETTGLNPSVEKITEIGAVKLKDGKIIDIYSQLINPEKPIPEKIVELTGIDDYMVKDKPTIREVLPEFLNFIGEAYLVAHNSDFDTSFIRKECENLGYEYKYNAIDTVALARALYPDMKNHKLATLVKSFSIVLENHHRATDDATATAHVFLKFVEDLKKLGAEKLSDINGLFAKKIDIKNTRSNHITILAKNQNGIKDLYKIISEAHINYFYKKPLIPKSLLRSYKENLLIGTACENGELFTAVSKGADDKKIRKIINLYDYIEVMPLSNNSFMIDKGLVEDVNDLINFNNKLIEIGEKYEKLVVATGDVHYLEPYESKNRAILQHGMKYKDISEESIFYYKTTEEMLKDFYYLPPDKAKEIVITNPNKIVDMIDDNIEPVPSGTFPPVIEGSDTELREMCMKKATRIYGDPLPEIVEARLERELKSIIGNGYAVMYIIAQRLVKDSLDHGFLVGSRGSVGSSFAATMSDITEVNPLCPHYVCENCKYSKFFTNGEYGSGPDMPDAICPNCGHPLKKDGFEIPFEVFLGFEGDKEPDIDLNFAGDYQACAHKYTGVLLGEKNTFKAGTISTVADKTAYGFVMKYLEEKGEILPKAEIERLKDGCTGIKRSTGQHPGGVMVVPDYKEVYDFTPIQYPANDASSGVITTHFDYHSISGRILKLDILGHDVPSMIRMLEDLTGLEGTKVPLDDKGTMSLFTSPDALECDLTPINCPTGSLGIPEFGTKFVRQMLMDTMPTTFAELIRISGLSHGTDVWLNNAQDLVRQKVTTLKEVISTRDDIMVYLMHAGLPPKMSFKIMESVRKGKGLTEEHIAEMKKQNVPQWYIDSCQKIKYMFPKAHAAAYVMMSYRIAYFKLHYKEAYYATYFTTKTDDFDIGLVSRGQEAVLERIKEIEKLGNEATTKEKNQLTILESVYEMYARGVEMLGVDIYKSDPKRFLLQDNKILPPLISVQGLGETVAEKIHEESKNEFISLEDFRKRTKASKTVVETLLNANCLRDLPETNQLSLF